MMKSYRIKKIFKTGVELKLFKRKLEFWNLFKNWKFENYLKINLKFGILKDYLKMRVLKIKFKN